MAEKLLKVYQFVTEKEGLAGKIKLAQVTKIPAVQAAVMHDTPELLEQFRRAAAEITGRAMKIEE